MAQECAQIVIDELTYQHWLKLGHSKEEIETAVERVNKGALLLDEHKPGWVDDVIPDTLDMKQAGFCIIGQTYGNYWSHVGVPFGMNVYNDAHMDVGGRAEEYGFMGDGKVTFAMLDLMWVYMLFEHKNSPLPVVLEMP